jgi:hypothetical protein
VADADRRGAHGAHSRDLGRVGAQLDHLGHLVSLDFDRLGARLGLGGSRWGGHDVVADRRDLVADRRDLLADRLDLPADRDDFRADPGDLSPDRRDALADGIDLGEDRGGFLADRREVVTAVDTTEQKPLETEGITHQLAAIACCARVEFPRKFHPCTLAAFGDGRAREAVSPFPPSWRQARAVDLAPDRGEALPSPVTGARLDPGLRRGDDYSLILLVIPAKAGTHS